MWLRLWVEDRGHDDMDLFIAIRKLMEKASGSLHRCWGSRTPAHGARCRCSRRALNPKLTNKYQPVQAHQG